MPKLAVVQPELPVPVFSAADVEVFIVRAEVFEEDTETASVVLGPQVESVDEVGTVTDIPVFAELGIVVRLDARVAQSGGYFAGPFKARALGIRGASSREEIGDQNRY